MLELAPYDLANCVRRLPKVLGERMMIDGMSICVAGGYIRSVIANEEVNDVDVMLPYAERAADLAKLLAVGLPNGSIWKSKNAYTVKTRPWIQIVTRWTFDSPAKAYGSATSVSRSLKSASVCGSVSTRALMCLLSATNCGRNVSRRVGL